MTCPICNSPLDLSYSRSRELMVCQCVNPKCAMCERQATGECTREATELLAGMALKFEARR